jgi:hypothetical protein
MSLSFQASEQSIPRGRRRGDVPAYVEAAVTAAVTSGKTQGAEGTRDEIHRAFLDVRRYRMEHEGVLNISVSEHHPKANESGPSRLLIEASKVETASEPEPVTKDAVTATGRKSRA